MRSLLRRTVWQINAVRNRDPLSPALFARLFGARGRRSWDPTTDPRRIVLLRSDEIGDTASTVTLLAALRERWPRAVIHLVVKPGPASMFHALPTVDRVIEWVPVTDGSALKRQLLTARQGLRRFGLMGYDLAILPRWDFDDTPIRFLAVATRARSIVGFSPVPEREPAWLGQQAALLTDEIWRGTTPLRTVDQLHRIAQYLGVPWALHRSSPAGMGLFDARDAEVAADRAGAAEDTGHVIGFGIGARDAKRQWPVEELAAVAERLTAQRPVSVRILGGSVDKERGERLRALLAARGIRGVDLTGRLSLSESAAAIAGCEAFLGNDSGLQHISSSINIPTVVVTCHPASGSPWSDNAPERFGPWSDRSAVLQPERPADGCGDECVAPEPHCIRAVGAEEAAETLELLLAGSSR
ncbi:glycosyltransferase family 9 protein [uncultured Microbacterium sp.]|uniref:glycosyltransferase family 9 protein n=1 Tax=uncultured Microbacterium sp. TaxID=191216 RepID=UPI0025D99CD9|nr:glycosyltransferase family 9 protein [uncultured Microbacterium sp.]